MLLKAFSAALLLLVASTPPALARRPLKVSSVKACTTLVLGGFSTQECIFEGGEDICRPATACTVNKDPVKNCPTFNIRESEIRYLYDCDDVAHARATASLPRGLLTQEYGRGLPTGRLAQLEPLGFIYHNDVEGQNLYGTNFEQLNQDIAYVIECYGVNKPDYVWGSLTADVITNLGKLTYEGQVQSGAVINAAGLVKEADPFKLNLNLGGKSVGFKTNSTDGKRVVVIDEEAQRGYVLVSIVATIDYDDNGYNLLKESEIRYYKQKGKLHR